MDFVSARARGRHMPRPSAPERSSSAPRALLQGKKATTHWAYHHLLPRVGAIPVKERVVRDGNRFTGGGVTAGIDFALTLMAEIAGPEIAQAVQLSLEYDPHPPFNSGSPRVARKAVKEAADERYAARLVAFEAVLCGLDTIEPRDRAIILPACNFLETAWAKTEARPAKRSSIQFAIALVRTPARDDDALKGAANNFQCLVPP